MAILVKKCSRKIENILCFVLFFTILFLTTIVAASECTDTAGWTDALGYSCSDYKPDDCLTASSYPNSEGIDANQACCVCSVPASSFSGCLDDENWVDSLGYSCSAYTSIECPTAEAYSNSNGVDATSACCVCKGSVQNTAACEDDADWVDSLGYPCAGYTSAECPQAPAYVNDKGVDAVQACCVCGGGGGLGSNPTKSSGCKDEEDWLDSLGYSCSAYTTTECPTASAYANSNGVDATQTCCVCGGGAGLQKSKSFNDPAPEENLGKSSPNSNSDATSEIKSTTERDADPAASSPRPNHSAMQVTSEKEAEPTQLTPEITTDTSSIPLLAESSPELEENSIEPSSPPEEEITTAPPVEEPTIPTLGGSDLKDAVQDPITLPSDSSKTTTDSSSGCVDDEEWFDSLGYPCSDYTIKECYNAIAYADSKGVDASQACCVCKSAPSPFKAVHTASGTKASSCTDDEDWVDSLGYDCSAYTTVECSTAAAYSNNNGVDAAQACCVCKDQATPSSSGSCADDENWVDSLGYACALYTAAECPNAAAYASADGVDATQACCVCKDEAATKSAGSAKSTAESSKSESCTDDENWMDSLGYTCALYTAVECPNAAVYASADGVDATTACCVCKEGAVAKSAVSPKSAGTSKTAQAAGASSSPTDCADDDNWMDSLGYTCALYTASECPNAAAYVNTDDVDATQACCVCKESKVQAKSVTGSTKAAAAPSPAAAPSAGTRTSPAGAATPPSPATAPSAGTRASPAASSGLRTAVRKRPMAASSGSACIDDSEWFDSLGYSCAGYTAAECPTAPAYANSGGVDATQACCVCKDCVDNTEWLDSLGYSCSAYTSAECPTAVAYANTNGIDATQACCVCKGAASAAVPLEAACTDNAEWYDSLGYDCSSYTANECANAARYASAGVSATTACCVCGGSSTATAPASAAAPDPAPAPEPVPAEAPKLSKKKLAAALAAMTAKPTSAPTIRQTNRPTIVQTTGPKVGKKRLAAEAAAAAANPTKFPVKSPTKKPTSKPTSAPQPANLRTSLYASAPKFMEPGDPDDLLYIMQLKKKLDSLKAALYGAPSSNSAPFQAEPEPQPVSPTCTDMAGWTDKLGYTCDAYKAEDCPTARKYVNSQGIGAIRACCTCGGGTAVPDCVDDPNWLDSLGYSCSAYTVDECVTAPYYVNSKGVDATQACCSCKQGATTLPATKKVMKTMVMLKEMGGKVVSPQEFDKMSGEGKPILITTYLEPSSVKSYPVSIKHLQLDFSATINEDTDEILLVDQHSDTGVAVIPEELIQMLGFGETSLSVSFKMGILPTNHNCSGFGFYFGHQPDTSCVLKDAENCPGLNLGLITDKKMPGAFLSFGPDSVAVSKGAESFSEKLSSVQIDFIKTNTTSPSNKALSFVVWIDGENVFGHPILYDSSISDHSGFMFGGLNTEKCANKFTLGNVFISTSKGLTSVEDSRIRQLLSLPDPQQLWKTQKNERVAKFLTYVAYTAGMLSLVFFVKTLISGTLKLDYFKVLP